MTYDDAGALAGVEFIVGIDTSGLILGEEGCVLHLSYIVVEGAGAHKLALGAYLQRHFGSEVSHLHRMLEGARRHFREAAQQRTVDVGEFHERHVAREIEQALD